MSSRRRFESLRNLVRRNFLTAAVVPLLLIELALVFMYFGTNEYLTRTWNGGLVDTVRRGVESAMRDCAARIETKLLEVERSTAVARQFTRQVVLGQMVQTSTASPPKFGVAKNGVFYKLENDGGASLFYAAPTKIGPEQRAKALLTESLDPLYKQITDANPNIVATYYNTHDDMNRYYPFVDHVYDQFRADLNMEEFNFYYEADQGHNPERKVVWTDAYLDPAGQGWMVSCVAPVYRGDFLEGVVGLDVTLAQLADRLLDLGLPWTHAAMIVNEGGSVLAMNGHAERLLGLEELKAHRYEETVEQEVLKPESFLLENVTHRAVGQEALRLLRSKEAFARTTVEGQTYATATRRLPIRDWRLMVWVDQAAVLAPVDRLTNLSRKLGFVAMGAIGLFYVLFLFFIVRSARRLAARIVDPVANLIARTKNPSHDGSGATSGIEEIDSLSNNFDVMMTEIDRRTDEIQSLNQNLEKRVQEEVQKNREKDHLLLEQSRLATMGEMIGAISHQWRQPLSVLRLLLSEMSLDAEEDTLEPEQVIETTKEADEVVVHMSHTIDDFRDLCAPPGPVTSFRLDEAVQKTVMLTEATLKVHGIELKSEVDGELAVKGRRNELCQVLLNLVHNGRDVLVERGVKDGHIYLRAVRKEGGLEISVEDNGGGVDDAVKDSIFEPYVTSKANGTGLGLYLARRIVRERFEGDLQLVDAENGARLLLTLP